MQSEPATGTATQDLAPWEGGGEKMGRHIALKPVKTRLHRI